LLSHIPKSKFFYPFYLANQLHISEEFFYSENLPKSLDGFRIAFFSDVHFGPMFKKERVLDLAEKVNSLDADVILMGGDYGEITRTSIEFFKVLPKLKSKYGCFASIGNHDRHGSKKEFAKLLQAIKDKNIIPLINEQHIISDANISLYASDDIYTGSPDLSFFDDTENYKDKFSIFFPHSPDILPKVLNKNKKAFDLALCGHTHGGQIALFGKALYSSSRYRNRYLSGWKKEKNHRIFISNGVGTSIMPVRFGARPQINLIILTSG
jgi:predicted MPP superfamily phosphohydrolase